MNATCDQCGEVNPADIHTCTPAAPVPTGAAPVHEPDETLLSFYQATDYPSLVAAMEGHIKKMQGKLQANPHTAIEAWNNREMHRTTPAAPVPDLTHDQWDQWQDKHGLILEREALSELRSMLYTSPAATPRLCTWTKSNDPNMPDTYHATCGVVWTFTDGGPGENNVRFCPGCGGELVEGQS